MLRGGDGMAGFAVRNPAGQIVHPYQWKPNSEYQDQSSGGGYYSVCIDNQFSRFAAKLVNLYITVVRYDLWEKYTKEVEELNMNMENFTVSCVTIVAEYYCGTVIFVVDNYCNCGAKHKCNVTISTSFQGKRNKRL